jgi:preprotein translocase subunit SecG
MSILLPIFTFVLILVALFLILVVLMQKAKSDGGMGAALGGGMSEATFGADTDNVLSKATINAAIVYFLLSFLLYLGNIAQLRRPAKNTGALPTIALPAQSAATGAPLQLALPPAAPAGNPAPASSSPGSAKP